MYDNKYKLATALLIAKQRKARVLYVFNSFETLKTHYNDLAETTVQMGFTCVHHTNTFIHVDGGTLTLKYVCEYNLNECTGLQITHLFYDDYVDCRVLLYLKVKVRTDYKFYEYHSGVYHSYGAEVIIDY